MMQKMFVAAFVMLTVCAQGFAQTPEKQHSLSVEEMRQRAQAEQPLYDTLDDELSTVDRDRFNRCFKVIQGGHMKAEMDHTFVRPYAVLWEQDGPRGCFIGEPKKRILPAKVRYATVALAMTPVDCLLKAMSCLKPDSARAFATKHGIAIDPAPFYDGEVR